MSLRHRLARLENCTASPVMLTDAIDRPPQETREQWLARIAGHPTPGLVNRRGETRDQWLARTQRDLAKKLGHETRFTDGTPDRSSDLLDLAPQHEAST